MLAYLLQGHFIVTKDTVQGLQSVSRLSYYVDAACLEALLAFTSPRRTSLQKTLVG